jgi:signal transduction histidine kinase/integral membrane sensor domain MASE1
MTPMRAPVAEAGRPTGALATSFRVAAFVVAYLLATQLAQLSQAGPESLTAIWPPSGLVLAVLALAEYRRWPLWLSVTWLTNLAQAVVIGGLSPMIAAGYSTTDVCEGALAAWLLIRTVGRPLTLGRLKEVVALVGVAAIGSNMVTGLLGAAVTVTWIPVGFGRAWFTWCLSNGVGMLQVAPLILAWRGIRRPTTRDLGSLTEAGILLASLAFVGSLVFSGDALASSWAGSLPYVTFPWLMWAALRTGPFVATLASGVVSALAVGYTAAGIGPFALASLSVAKQVLAVQLFVGVAVLSSLVPAAVVAERRRAERHARRLNRLYALLSETSQAVVKTRDRAAMLSGVCRIATTSAPFLLAWVGRLSPSGTDLVVEASDGPGRGYVAAGVIPIDPVQERRGPNGRAVRDDRLVVFNDLREMDADAGWRRDALAEGFRSGATVPLHVDGRVWGVFALYAAERGFFDPAEARLLEELGAVISFGLESIERESQRAAVQEASSSLERQLRQAQKMEAIGRMAGGIAHDFNNLLQVIKGFADLALDDVTESDPSRGPLQEIQKAAGRARELTSRLLLFSRKQVTSPEVIDLNQAIREMEAMLRRVIGEDVAMVTEFDGRLGPVRADPGQVEQVVINLVVNSRDAMPHGGRLTIVTRNLVVDGRDPHRPADLKPGRYAVLSVRDTGTGMSEAVQSRVFEPFFTTKARGKGTGLGLATVYGVVSQSGGHVTFASREGAGTTFDIHLPVVEDAGDAASVVPASGPRRGTETLLVVEDEDQVRTIARSVLERLGYSVLDAPGGEQALAIARDYPKPIDLLLTDVIMPGHTGPQVAHRVKELRPLIKVLYMSGYTDDALSPHGVLDAGQVLVQKPFSAELLSIKVRQVLESSGEDTP